MKIRKILLLLTAVAVFSFFTLPISIIGLTMSAHAFTVKAYGVGKMQVYRQTTETQVEFSNYMLHARVEAIPESDILKAVTVAKPSGATPPASIPITEMSTGNFFYDHDVEIMDSFDLLYPDGEYVFQLDFEDPQDPAGSPFTEFRTMNLGGGYPTQVPLITNHTTGDNLGLTPTFQWAPWTPDRSDDTVGIQLSIWSDEGLVYGVVDLPFNATEHTIPFGVLDPNEHYMLSLGFHYASSHGDFSENGYDAFMTTTTFEFNSESPPLTRVANFFVQHRVYEDGREFNRFYFTLRDEANNIILDEIAADVKLTDPNGQQVPISDLEFAKVRYSFPWYDGNTGQWIYSFDLNGELFHDEGEYFGVVPDPLVEGDYQLTVTDEEGNQYVGQFRFNGYQGLPIIRSSSFKYKFDKSGNMIWTWKVPYDFNPTFDTSVRPFIKITNHDGNNSYLFPRVPTHLGRLFVPNYVVDKVKEEGDQYEMIIDLRTNDNNNRTYSKARKLKFQKHHTKGHKHPKH